MRGGGDNITVRHGIHVLACRNKTGDMRHINHQQCADFVSDLAQNIKTDLTRICRCARHDELRFIFDRQLADNFIINITRFLIHAVRHEVVELTREVDGRAVGQVTAVRKVHTKHGIARLDECEICRLVRLRARVRLYVGVLGTEQLARTLTCNIFNHVDLLATTVVTLARIAFCIFIGENAAHRRHHRGRDNVF